MHIAVAPHRKVSVFLLHTVVVPNLHFLLLLVAHSTPGCKHVHLAKALFARASKLEFREQDECQILKEDKEGIRFVKRELYSVEGKFCDCPCPLSLSEGIDDVLDCVLALSSAIPSWIQRFE